MIYYSYYSHFYFIFLYDVMQIINATVFPWFIQLIENDFNPASYHECHLASSWIRTLMDYDVSDESLATTLQTITHAFDNELARICVPVVKLSEETLLFIQQQLMLCAQLIVNISCFKDILSMKVFSRLVYDCSLHGKVMTAVEFMLKSGNSKVSGFDIIDIWYCFLLYCTISLCFLYLIIVINYVFLLFQFQQSALLLLRLGLVSLLYDSSSSSSSNSSTTHARMSSQLLEKHGVAARSLYSLANVLGLDSIGNACMTCNASAVDQTVTLSADILRASYQCKVCGAKVLFDTDDCNLDDDMPRVVVNRVLSHFQFDK